MKNILTWIKKEWARSYIPPRKGGVNKAPTVLKPNIKPPAQRHK